MGEKKTFFWLKLKDNFFQQKEIKKLRRIAGGDTYTVIYLKMLLIAIKNDGSIFFEEVEETFTKEIALELDESEENVEVTIQFLLRHNLLEIIEENVFSMPMAMELTGKESSVAERVRKHREKKNIPEKKLEFKESLELYS